MEILELQPAWVWMQHLELIVDIRKRMCILGCAVLPEIPVLTAKYSKLNVGQEATDYGIIT